MLNFTQVPEVFPSGEAHGLVASPPGIRTRPSALRKRVHFNLVAVGYVRVRGRFGCGYAALCASVETLRCSRFPPMTSKISRLRVRVLQGNLCLFSGLKDLSVKHTIATAAPENTADRLTWTAQSSAGSIEVAKVVPEKDRAIWSASFQKYAADHRYYDLISQTLADQFDHRFLLLGDHDGSTRAVQPVFLVSQDLLIGLPNPVRRMVAKIRSRFPSFLKCRMLMIGNSAGEGDLALDARTGDPAWTALVLKENLTLIARKLGAALIVFKDFPQSYRSILDDLRTAGFTRIPSMPATSLQLDFGTFDEYLHHYLSHAMRKNLRRKFRKAEQGLTLTFEALTDVSPYVDDLLALYSAVFQRSKLHFEKLNAAYLSGLGKSMPDRARFFLWRHNGRIIAFASCLVSDGVLKDNYIGLDYSLALEYHLYFLTWRDTISWAVQNGCRIYHSAPLNYDPKLHFRMKLDPLDLYVRAAWDWLNPLLRRLLPLMEPTRYDHSIQQFPNRGEL